MKFKKILSTILVTTVIFTSTFCVTVSAQKINNTDDTIDQAVMDLIFGSPEGFDSEMRRIILEDNNNVIKLADIQKMDRSADGKFAPTKK